MRRIVFAWVAAAVALVACGGGDTVTPGGSPPAGGAPTADGEPTTGPATTAPAEEPPGGGPAAPGEYCTWFTAEMAEQVIGEAVTRDEDLDADECTYSAESGASATVTSSDPRGFEMLKETFEGVEVDVGQAAFNSDTGLVVVVNDDLALQIVVVTVEGGFGINQEAQLELAQLVVPNIS